MRARSRPFRGTRPTHARTAAPLLCALALTLLLAPTASADNSCVWIGTTSTDWGTDANWSSCGNDVQGPTDTVTIVTAGNQPVVTAGTESAASVTLSGTGTLTVSGGTLTVAGQISAPSGTNVTLSGGTLGFGTLQVAGASDLTVTGGSLSGGTLSSTTAATTLAIAPTDFGTTGLTLGANVTVQQTADMTMAGGTLAIGNHTYRLTNDASILAGSGTITIGPSGKLQKLGGIFESTVQPHVISTGTIQDSSDSGGDLQLQPTVAGDELSGTVGADQDFIFGNGNYQFDSPGLTLADTGSYGTSGSSHINLNGQTLTVGSSGYEMQSGSSITGSGTRRWRAGGPLAPSTTTCMGTSTPSSGTHHRTRCRRPSAALPCRGTSCR